MTSTCRECGKEIPKKGSDLFCPSCLLSLALVKEPEVEVSEKAKPVTNEPSTPFSSTARMKAKTPESSELSCGFEMEKIGDWIGPYRLVKEIGAGGCGMVYLAEQSSPVKRKVALKVVKLGMDTRQVIARFQAERQALALMDHPNIARVLEAGATPTGRPYFVMELVEGVKITEFCQEQRLNIRQRLELFVQVCRAIQHAHQKGIIHRDIKPSNVLVGLSDGLAVPKVIDFGIAKATHEPLTDHTVFTAQGQFLGTPAYMSPEQTQLGAQDVDTRSDIYSLGVLLYELLSGETPFRSRELFSGGLEAMRRMICEKEPPTPSSRLKLKAEAVQGEGKPVTDETERPLATREDYKQLRGDLDWIVMKCLEKDRSRRYDTANGLARDIERFLGSEPVQARPTGNYYRFQKFVRRNRAITAATIAVALAMLLATGSSIWQTAQVKRALWKEYAAEARAIRVSGHAGRRYESLEAIRKAAAITPSLALRNEAIASMVLPDIRWIGGKDFVKSRESVSLHPTFESYASCKRDGQVSLRSLTNEAAILLLPEVGAPATSVGEFSPDGHFLVVNYADARSRVWDWGTRTILLDQPLIRGFAFTPDSSVIAISDTTNIALYDLRTRKQDRSFSLPSVASPEAPGWLRFDPSGSRLAVYTTEQDTNVFIVDSRSGTTLKTLSHDDHVFTVGWHPNSKYLATGAANRTIRIWDTVRGEQINAWQTESSVSVAFVGGHLVSSGFNGYTILWDFMNGRKLLEVYKSGAISACSQTNGKLALAHWTGTGFELLELGLSTGLRALYETSASASGGGEPFLDDTDRFVGCGTRDGIGLWDFQSGEPIPTECGKQSSLIAIPAGGRELILTRPEGLFRCPIATLNSKEISKPELITSACADEQWGRVGVYSEEGKIAASWAIIVARFLGQTRTNCRPKRERSLACGSLVSVQTGPC